MIPVSSFLTMPIFPPEMTLGLATKPALAPGSNRKCGLIRSLRRDSHRGARDSDVLLGSLPSARATASTNEALIDSQTRARDRLSPTSSWIAPFSAIAWANLGDTD